jgi:hypothetical protein
MHRSMRNLLGLAAAGAIATAGLTTLTTAANAATVQTAATSASSAGYAHDFDDSWGRYYSRSYHGSRAMARGDVFDDEDGDLHVTGRLYDRGFSNRLCAYVEVRFEDSDGDERHFTAVKCGSHGYRSFHFRWHDVESARVRVSYWDRYDHHRVKTGQWHYVYESEDEEA